jgi:hypothetical protein
VSTDYVGTPSSTGEFILDGILARVEAAPTVR